MKLAPLLAAASIALLAATVRGQVEPAPEFRVLFDGTSLDAWRGYATEAVGSGWVLRDGALWLEGAGGDLITRETFEHFKLEFEFLVSPGANSGVMYRVRTGDDASYFSGPEFQVLDDAAHADGQNLLHRCGALYGLYEAEGVELKPVGEWNSAAIVVDSDHVEHWLNGKKVVDCQIGGDDWNKRVASSKFKQWKQFAQQPRGHLCLQDHGNRVAYRNIRIQVLGKPGAGDARPEARGEGDGR